MRIKLKAYRTSPTDTVLQVDCLGSRHPPTLHEDPHILPWTLRLMRACVLTVILLFGLGGVVAALMALENAHQHLMHV